MQGEKSIILEFQGTPKAIQSVRFARKGNFITKYQPKTNVDWKTYIKLSAIEQLPANFKMLTCPIHVSYEFYFGIPKSASKKFKNAVCSNNTVYKPTRPDLSDNLRKGVTDALTGIVWSDDSIICSDDGLKAFAETPLIRLVITTLDNEV